jgi:N-acylglucosamine 2-epimerase
MIMLNVSQELAEALAALRHAREQEVREHAGSYMNTILTRFAQPDHTVTELLPVDEELADTLMSRHLNPGHTIECMWFVMTEAKRVGNTAAIDQAIRITKKAFELGWDNLHGGLLHYVDRDGGTPRGRELGDNSFERNIIETPDTKLWWPHSEALYTLLLAYEQTGDAELLKLYDKTHDYTFSTFPHPDPAVGEWIQIRDRTGVPLTKVVALPVKDPYHILRNLILIVELLSTEQDV